MADVARRGRIVGLGAWVRSLSREGNWHDHGPGDRTSDALRVDHRSGTVPDSHRLRGSHGPVFNWRAESTPTGSLGPPDKSEISGVADDALVPLPTAGGDPPRPPAREVADGPRHGGATLISAAVDPAARRHGDRRPDLTRRRSARRRRAVRSRRPSPRTARRPARPRGPRHGTSDCLRPSLRRLDARGEFTGQAMTIAGRQGAISLPVGVIRRTAGRRRACLHRQHRRPLGDPPDRSGRRVATRWSPGRPAWCGRRSSTRPAAPSTSTASRIQRAQTPV